jgi:hypothetical protein
MGAFFIWLARLSGNLSESGGLPICRHGHLASRAPSGFAGYFHVFDHAPMRLIGGHINAKV